jgi:hypothetical protein
MCNILRGGASLRRADLTATAMLINGHLKNSRYELPQMSQFVD